MAQLAQTITVVNTSGRVVKTSKHLFNVFKEAKSAYRERKAEIRADRQAELDEKRARKALAAIGLNDDARSRASSRRSSKSQRRPEPGRSKSHRHSKPPMGRGYTDSVYANEEGRTHGPSGLRYERDLFQDSHRREITRRHSEGSPIVRRSRSDEHIDMDLAYGELPPPLPQRTMDDAGELREKMSKLTVLLDEAHCLQHSVTTTIDSLQKNPEALAAVALTLAEISNLATKLGPGVLASMKTSFPAVLALLASPQFMIAGGVAVGVTIVALGGYKVIKKINKERKERELMEPMQMEELEPPELSAIETWRRGIADAEAESVGSTVDGEFITPGASRYLVDAGVLDDLRSRKSSRSRKESSKRKAPKTSKSSPNPKSEKGDKKKKRKEPSGLKLLLSSRSHTH